MIAVPTHHRTAYQPGDLIRLESVGIEFAIALLYEGIVQLEVDHG